jgi:hypothetical protein
MFLLRAATVGPSARGGVPHSADEVLDAAKERQVDEAETSKAEMSAPRSWTKETTACL